MHFCQKRFFVQHWIVGISVSYKETPQSLLVLNSLCCRTAENLLLIFKFSCTTIQGVRELGVRDTPFSGASIAFCSVDIPLLPSVDLSLGLYFSFFPYNWNCRQFYWPFVFQLYQYFLPISTGFLEFLCRHKLKRKPETAEWKTDCTLPWYC